MGRSTAREHRVKTTRVSSFSVTSWDAAMMIVSGLGRYTPTFQNGTIFLACGRGHEQGNHPKNNGKNPEHRLSDRFGTFAKASSIAVPIEIPMYSMPHGHIGHVRAICRVPI